MTKTSYRILLFSLFIILFSFGIFFGYRYIDKKNDNVNDNITNNIVSKEIDIYEEFDKPVINNNIKDITVTCEVKYLLCNETLVESQNVISVSKDDIKEKYKEYYVVEEDDKSIKFRKDVNKYCPNHFLLKILNDYVVIYRYISDDEIEIYKSTEIHKNELHEEVIKEFKDGLRVNSLEELNSIIEEIES